MMVDIGEGRNDDPPVAVDDRSLDDRLMPVGSTWLILPARTTMSLAGRTPFASRTVVLRHTSSAI